MTNRSSHEPHWFILKATPWALALIAGLLVFLGRGQLRDDDARPEFKSKIEALEQRVSAIESDQKTILSVVEGIKQLQSTVSEVRDQVTSNSTKLEMLINGQQAKP